MSEKTSALLEYVKENSRVCPKPDNWNKLWEMLPNRKRKGGGWNPPLPLILAAWWETSDDEKRDRLAMHIRHAGKHGALEEIDAFLRVLPSDQWVYKGDI
jgi:hypothetical protein